jgi:hypothetical protein
MENEYPPTKPAVIAALAGYLLRRSAQGWKAADPETEAAELELLIAACIPHGPIGEVWTARKDDAQLLVYTKIRGIRSQIPGSGARFMDPESFILILALTLFGGHLRLLNTLSKAEAERRGITEGRHYPYVLGGTGTLLSSDAGITLPRLLADAGPGEDVRFACDHHDLRMGSLRLVKMTQRTYQGREDTICEALRRREKAAHKSSAVLSPRAYEALLRSAFDLLDACHGHKIRPQRAAAE